MKTASIKDVAKLANVSVATVSRYMNSPSSVSEAMRLKVQDAIRQTGFVPNSLARNLRRGRTNLVMVVLPSVGIPFFGGVVNGIQKAAQSEGFSVVIEETQFNTLEADDVSRMLVSRQIDGLILLASISPFGTEILSFSGHRRIPMVIGCETVSADLSSLPSVHIDNIAAAREATNYLIARGHRRIGLITGAKNALLTADRESGFLAAMREAHLPVQSGWIAEGQMTFKGAAHATRRLLAEPDAPTAIFCLNDEMAIACMHEIRCAGMRVPDDISVVGFDDIPHSEYAYPPLTTVRQPADEIGERAMYRLGREIEGRKNPAPGPEYVAHSLVVRQSAGDAPA